MFSIAERIVIVKRSKEKGKREEALVSLYDQYYDKIVRYIYTSIRNRDEAENMASEVFLKALQSLDSYRERGLPMKAWIFKIAHNLLVDYIRSVSKRKLVSIDKVEITDPTDPAKITEKQLQMEELFKALKDLSPAQSEVIGLRFFAGLTSIEAGKILGKSPGAVREMQSMALKSLRNILGEIYYD